MKIVRERERKSGSPLIFRLGRKSLSEGASSRTLFRAFVECGAGKGMRTRQTSCVSPIDVRDDRRSWSVFPHQRYQMNRTLVRRRDTDPSSSGKPGLLLLLGFFEIPSGWLQWCATAGSLSLFD